MPCRDYDDGRVQYVDRPETVLKLCAALTALERAGVAIPEVCQRWWQAHKREDRARREVEAARVRNENRRKQILSKLSEEDKKTLGLK